jgi:hypothetical protein
LFAEINNKSVFLFNHLKKKKDEKIIVFFSFYANWSVC